MLNSQAPVQGMKLRASVQLLSAGKCDCGNFLVTNSFTPKLLPCCSCTSGYKLHCINTLGFFNWKGLWWKAQCCNGLSQFRGQVTHDRIAKLIRCPCAFPGKCKGSLQMCQPFNLKKTTCSFPPGTEPNCSKPLVYLSTEADQIISCSKPIFFYLYAFSNFRTKIISNHVQRNLSWKFIPLSPELCFWSFSVKIQGMISQQAPAFM